MLDITEEQAKDIFKYLLFKKIGHLDTIGLFNNMNTKLLMARSKQTKQYLMVFINTTDSDVFTHIYGDTYAQCLKFMQDIMATHNARLMVVWNEIDLPRSLEELLIEMDLNR